jgi:hypothetical protein
MLFKKRVIDERVRNAVGRWSAVWLGVTQIMLFGALFYRLYVLGQPDEELNDFRFVLGVSVLGGLALHLFLGGLLPVLTWQGAVAAWAVLAGAVAGVSLAIHGVPGPGEWASTWLPGLAGPAIFVGLYWLVAYLGDRRIERMIEDAN